MAGVGAEMGDSAVSQGKQHVQKAWGRMQEQGVFKGIKIEAWYNWSLEGGVVELGW